MKGFLLRVAVAFVVMFLLSLAAAELAVRYLPTNGTGWLYTAALIALFSALAAGVELLYRRSRDSRKQQEDSHRTAMQLLREQYDAQARDAQIPGGAAVVPCCCYLLAPHAAVMPHYLWKQEHELLLFPTWEGIAARENVVNRLGREKINGRASMYPIRVHEGAVEFYSLEMGLRGTEPFTMLRYREVGETMGLFLGRAAYPVLLRMLPDLDRKQMQQKEYPHSSRQIEDITRKMQQLRSMYDQELIEDSEYTAKKTQLLLLM